MKNICFFLLLSAFVKIAEAQTTITNATFPKAGDKLKLVQNLNFSGTLNMGSVAGPQIWDFNALNSGRTFEEFYQDAKSGKDAASFTDATLVLEQDGQEEYFTTSSSTMEGVGFGGENPIFGAPIVVRYNKKPTVRTAPLTFIGSTKSEGEFRIQLPANVFPDSILANIPATFRPDSVRISFISSSSGLMDAYGTLNMQGQSFEVLREKANVASQTKIFLRVPLFGWQDLETLITILNIPLPEFITGFLGAQKFTQYNFYSNAKKEILVSASYDSLNVLDEILFANLGGVTSSAKDTYIPEFNVFPNPVSDIMRIHTPELKSGNYLLSIADANGRVIYAEIAGLNPNGYKEIDLSIFSSGIYFMTIRDQFNSFSITRKLIKA